MYQLGITTRKFGILDHHVFKFNWIPKELIGKELSDHLPIAYKALDMFFPTWRQHLISHTVTADHDEQGSAAGRRGL